MGWCAPVVVAVALASLLQLWVDQVLHSVQFGEEVERLAVVDEGG